MTADVPVEVAQRGDDGQPVHRTTRGEPTRNPALVITRDVEIHESLAGLHTVTHVPTGTAVAKWLPKDRAHAIADQVADLDWSTITADNYVGSPHAAAVEHAVAAGRAR